MSTRPPLSTRRVRKLKRRAPIGAPPGTMISDPSAPKPSIRVLGYGAESIIEERVSNLEQLRTLLDRPGRPPVIWIDVAGLGDAKVIAGIGAMLGLHKLALEDVINVHQRPKLDVFPGSPPWIFFVARMAEPPASERDALTTDQLSIFLGTDCVLTFQERPGDCFDPVRARLRENAGRIRSSGPDYLVYSLLDATVDAYFPCLERLGEQLEAHEEHVVGGANGQSATELHRIKRDLLTVRRSMWPLRDALGSLYRDTSPLVKDETRLFLRDCNDHTVQIIDLVETYREIGSDLMDVHLTQLNNRTNEVMKVLAIIATLFIPLNFVAALYGMNFDPDASPLNMPELRSRYGYPAVLLLMAGIVVGMLAMYRRRGWIGGRRKGIVRGQEDRNGGERSPDRG